ncbi:MAG: 2'-5' RNA ligase family protein [Bacteroidota bacterium]|nr:2'-5' RNA ligase family protein [Bacteroidota bacterium]
MEQTTKYSPPIQFGLYEYLLVAHPDAAVNKKVMMEKELFVAEYGQKMAAKTKPHITIANFLAHDAMEETILRYTQRVCSQLYSFEVVLNNYSGFPPHTIFLRVQNPQPFKQFAKELKVVSNYVSSCSCPPLTLITNPHLIIASRLPETVYLKAMMDYSQKSFHETFMVTELVLLRRDHQYDTCKAIHVFRLQPPSNNLFNNLLFN